jgi:phosphoglycolate phosphatase
MISKKYKLYVFDLDGTLADTKIDLTRAFSKALTANGFKAPSVKEAAAAVGNGALKAIQRLTGLDEAAAAPLEEAFRKIYEDICCDNVRLYEGARELLLRLKGEGAVLALVTMKFKAPTQMILRFLDIDIFDEAIAFEDAQKRKEQLQSFAIAGAIVIGSIMVGIAGLYMVVGNSK